MSTVSMERLETDTQNFKENIDPLIGGTDIIIFAFGADINNGGEYTGNVKFEYLKSQAMIIIAMWTLTNILYR